MDLFEQLMCENKKVSKEEKNSKLKESKFRRRVKESDELDYVHYPSYKTYYVVEDNGNKILYYVAQEMFASPKEYKAFAKKVRERLQSAAWTPEPEIADCDYAAVILRDYSTYDYFKDKSGRYKDRLEYIDLATGEILSADMFDEEVMK